MSCSIIQKLNLSMLTIWRFIFIIIDYENNLHNFLECELYNIIYHVGTLNRFLFTLTLPKTIHVTMSMIFLSFWSVIINHYIIIYYLIFPPLKLYNSVNSFRSMFKLIFMYNKLQIVIVARIICHCL